MKLADAILICVQVLKMQPAAVALAYAIPVAEVEAVVAATTRRKTGKFAPTPVTTEAAAVHVSNGVYAKGHLP